jgi:hypothetical protein
MHKCERQNLCKQYIKWYDHVQRVQNAKNSTSPSYDFLCTFAVLSLVYISPRETLELANYVHMKKKKLYQSDVDCCEIPLRRDECCLSVCL